MKKQTYSVLSLGLLLAFLLWTTAAAEVDVQPIGPEGSAVGFATLNAAVQQRIGVHMGLYVLTDWLSLIPLGFAAGFALLGLFQWIRRKGLSQVDRGILALGGVYLVTAAAYLLFEVRVINYRPVLIDGVLEASYPSSTTLLSMCVLSTAAMDLWKRIRDPRPRNAAVASIILFAVFMVAARMLSGVHWFTDIVGGLLLSGCLICGYAAAK